MWKEFSDIHTVQFGKMIDEFRGKLPLTRKSELVQQFLSANLVYKYTRLEELNTNEVFTTLYGDTRIVVVDRLEDLDSFIAKWRERISTVAINPDDEDTLDYVESQMITRICDIGTMQFPDFFEQFDPVDDFDIYVGDDR